MLGSLLLLAAAVPGVCTPLSRSRMRPPSKWASSHRISGDPVLSRDVWLLIHREGRESARVAVVADWLVERFTADAHLFHGLGGNAAPLERRPLDKRR